MFVLVYCVVIFQIFDLNLAQIYDDITLVNTTNGTVRGVIERTIEQNRPFVAFRGIPYASPPLGDLRFRPPEPAKNWTEVRDASRDGSCCVQPSPKNFILAMGTEDCLFINVYSPKLELDDNHLLPVLVWIHGGAFISGDSSYSSFGPDHFLNEGIIFVSFNYRLGIFGFMSTGDLASPGNYGLKDQILALRWIQDNIRAFGGNPNEVTISGESAGAASVSYLMQSPLTTGLYQRAISNSGSSLCQWALNRNPRDITQTIAQLYEIDTSNTTKMVDELRKKENSLLFYSVAFDWTEFKKRLLEFDETNFLHGLLFSPTIELEHDGAVLSGKSHQLLENHNYNNVPYLMGFNSKEAGGWLEKNAFLGLSISEAGGIFLSTYEGFTNYHRLTPGNENFWSYPFWAGHDIKRHYGLFFRRIASKQGQRNFENFLTDDQFVRPIREMARLYSRHVPVYFYQFSYMGNLGLLNSPSIRYSTEGVSHAEDLGYLFRTHKYSKIGSYKDYVTRCRLVKLWSNFVKYGNPTPTHDDLLQNITWPMARTSNSYVENLLYLDIGENLIVKNNPRHEHITFWQNLYRTYGQPPYDTY